MAASKIGGLFVSLDLNYAKFVDGLDKSRTKSTAFGVAVGNVMSSIAISIGRMVGTAAASLPRLIENSIDVADAMGKSAQKAQVSVESFSALAHAADLSDVSVESLTTSLGRFGRNIAEAQSGNKKLAGAFREVGVSLNDLKTLSVDEVFAKVAGGFSAIPDGAKKAQVGFNLFGRAYQDLVPLLNQGTEGIRRTTEEAQKLGLVIGTQTAKQAEQFNDNLKSLRGAVSGMGQAIAKDLLPKLVDISEATLEWVKTSNAIPRAAQLATDFFHGLVIELGAAIVGFDGVVVSMRSLQVAYGQFKAFIAIGIPGGAFLLPAINKDIEESKKALEKAQVDLGNSLNAFDVLIGNRPAPKLPSLISPDKPEQPEIVDPDAQKKLESLIATFQKSLKPADDLNKELQQIAITGKSTADILAVYGDEIIKAVEAQKAHGKDIPPFIKSLELIASAQNDNRESLRLWAEESAFAAPAISGLFFEAAVASVKGSTIVTGAMDDLIETNKRIVDDFNDKISKVSESFASLGIKSQQELNTIANATELAYQRSGLAAEAGSKRELTARLAMLSAQREALIAAGREFTKLQQKELDAAQKQLEKFANQDKLKDGFEQVGLALSSGIEEAMRKWEGFGKLAIGILNDIAATILRNAVTAPLSSWLGTVLGSLGSVVGGLGAGAAGAVAAPLPMVGNFAGFASGGHPPVGVPAWVGERGPEIFVPQTAGTIIPNEAIGNSQQTVINYNIDARGAGPGVEAEIRRALRDVEDRAVMRSVRTVHDLKLRTA